MSSFYLRAAMNLNNVGISLLEVGKLSPASTALQDALEAMKCSVRLDEEQPQRHMVFDQKLSRAITALQTEESSISFFDQYLLLTASLIRFPPCGPHEMPTSRINIHEGCAIVLHNLALFYQLNGLNDNQSILMRKSLSLCHLVYSIVLDVREEQDDQDQGHNLPTRLLFILVNVLNCMGQVHSYLGEHDLAQECFRRLNTTLAETLFSPDSLLAAPAA